MVWENAFFMLKTKSLLSQNSLPIFKNCSKQIEFSERSDILERKRQKSEILFSE